MTLPETPPNPPNPRPDLAALENPYYKPSSPAADAAGLGFALFAVACIMGGVFGHAVRVVYLDGNRGPYNWTLFATFVCAGFVVMGVCFAVAILAKAIESQNEK